MSVCERKAHSLIELKILIALLVVGVTKGGKKMNCCQGNITSSLDQKVAIHAVDHCSLDVYSIDNNRN